MYEGGSQEEDINEQEAEMEFEDQRDEYLKLAHEPYETSMNPDFDPAMNIQRRKTDMSDKLDQKLEEKKDNRSRAKTFQTVLP